MNSTQIEQKFLKSPLFFLIFSTIFHIIHAKQTQPASVAPFFYQTRNSTRRWRDPVQLLDSNMKPSVPFLLAGILSFLASAISSAGGIGGGGLYISILTIVAGLDLKTTSSFTAFMVTGGSIVNVVCYMFPRIHKRSGKTLIDYDVALLSQPCVLLGVSCGVICNLVFPEWLIMIILVIFLGFCTYKTFKSGVSYWKRETESLERRNACLKMESTGEAFDGSDKVPLLSEKQHELESGTPWMKLGMLIIIWLAFFVLYLLRGDQYGQGIINIEVCGKAYWIISSIQIPLVIIFTVWILYTRKSLENNAPPPTPQEIGNHEARSKQMHMLPIMALPVGFLSGLFGIGGGMLVSPLLLQIGLEPEVTAATCSFMVFFSSSMSAIQYLLMGMKQVYGALIYSAVCFVASLVGLIIVQRAITKHGRASIVVFSVGIVLALSTVLITGYGAVDIWKEFTTGQSMGFKKPC